MRSLSFKGLGKGSMYPGMQRSGVSGSSVIYTLHVLAGIRYSQGVPHVWAWCVLLCLLNPILAAVENLLEG